jgi:hypothetical protein
VFYRYESLGTELNKDLIVAWFSDTRQMDYNTNQSLRKNISVTI